MKLFAYGWSVFVILVLIGYVTQVLIPLWKGTAFFPLLRWRRRDIETELTKEREIEDTLASEAELARLQKKHLKAVDPAPRDGAKPRKK